MIIELKGVEITMFLQDFIAERGIKQSTASMYMTRHTEEFDGHTSIKDGKTWLDDVAVELLSKKYPVKPVDDIWTPTAKKAYDALQEDLRDSGELIKELARENKRLHKVELEYKALETQQLMLIEKAVSEKQAELDIQHAAELQNKQDEIDQLKLKLDQMEKNTAELEMIKGRKLKLMERLVGRIIG